MSQLQIFPSTLNNEVVRTKSPAARYDCQKNLETTTGSICASCMIHQTRGTNQTGGKKEEERKKEREKEKSGRTRAREWPLPKSQCGNRRVLSFPLPAHTASPSF